MRALALWRTCIAVALSLAFLFSSQAAMPETQAAPDIQAGGISGPTAAGVRVDPGKIVPPIHGETPEQARQVPRLYPVDPAAFGRLKAEANAAAAAKGKPPGSGGTPASGPAPSFGTLDFSQSGGWNPPDGAIAVGQSNILVAVNEALAIYSKSGKAIVAGQGPSSFSGLFGTSDSTFDPRALYDGGRFVVLAVSQNGSAKTSSYQLAISNGETPSSWCTYSLNAVTGSGTSAAWADFPGLGMDSTNLYITSNQFSFSSGSFQFARALAIPKASVYPNGSGGCTTTATSTDYQQLRDPNGGYAFTVQPVSGSSYFVNALWSSGSQLVVRGIGSMDAPKAVNVAPYNLPADAPQPGFRAKAIDTGDDRLLAAMFANNRIYTSNNTRSVSSSLSNSPNTYSNAQWYAIDASQVDSTSYTAPTTAITNPNVAYYFPTVAALGNGSVGIGVSGSGLSQTASAFWATATSGPTAFAGGASSYSMASRWGDYAASAADPSGGSVWVFGEYAKTSMAWGTAIAPVP